MPAESQAAQWPIGLSLDTPGRTVTEAECAVLVSLCWTRGMLHSDAVAAAAGPFGVLTVPGPIVVALMVGLCSSAGHHHQIEQHGLRMVAVLGSENRYVSPLRFGDTLRVTAEVVEARPSKSRADHFVVTVLQRGWNQDGEVVAEVREATLAMAVAQSNVTRPVPRATRA
jgi:acyl dehydratase